MKQLAPTVPRVQLIEDAATLLAAEARGADIPTVTEAGLQAISGYATGIGIDKDVVLDPRMWAWASSSHVVATAHDHQLTVDVYTLNANITECVKPPAGVATWRPADLLLSCSHSPSPA